MGLLRTGLLTACLALLAGCSKPAPPPSSAAQRLVVLSPGIAETLFAIGAGEQVAGVSDYADWPPEAASRPKVGSTLTPAFEAIARLKPTAILDERVKQAPQESLSALAPVTVLPWLSLDEVVSSTRALGRLAGREAQANALADRLRETLTRKPPPDAPRVLLALGDSPGQLSSVWYIKRGSLHGAALEAAGARNAAEEEVSGPPNLSLERVIAMDPDAVVVLVEASTPLDETAQERYLSAWRELSVLRAVKQGRVRLVWGKGVQSVGPRTLELVEKLRAALRDLPRAP